MKTFHALLLVMAVCFSESVHGQVMVSLRAAKDTSINQTNPTFSDGGGPAFFTGGDGNSVPHRALIAFDFSSIPANATITNVQLTLTLGSVPGGGAGASTIGLYGVVQNWGEGITGSTASGISGTGQGFAPNIGDATWVSAAHQQTLWTNAGGDHANTASASLSLPTTTQIDIPFTWGSTSRLVADVQGWRNNPSTNFGWEIINTNETVQRTIFGFYSNEWDNTHFGGSTSQVPALQVIYVVPLPEPGTAGLLTCGSFMWFAGRRRHARAA